MTKVVVKMKKMTENFGWMSYIDNPIESMRGKVPQILLQSIKSDKSPIKVVDGSNESLFYPDEELGPHL